MMQNSNSEILINAVFSMFIYFILLFPCVVNPAEVRHPSDDTDIMVAKDYYDYESRCAYILSSPQVGLPTNPKWSVALGACSHEIADFNSIPYPQGVDKMRAFCNDCKELSLPELDGSIRAKVEECWKYIFDGALPNMMNAALLDQENHRQEAMQSIARAKEETNKAYQCDIGIRSKPKPSPTPKPNGPWTDAMGNEQSPGNRTVLTDKYGNFWAFPKQIRNTYGRLCNIVSNSLHVDKGPKSHLIRTYATYVFADTGGLCQTYYEGLYVPR
jgi:hypothetical protein